MSHHAFLAHTADTRLYVEATSEEELFQEALLGLSELLTSKTMPTSPVVRQVTISSQDETALLIDFLAEVLTFSHIDHAVFTKVEFTQFTKTALTAHLYGIHVLCFEKDVKAVTYHEAKIEKTKSGFSTIVIFDI